MSSRITAAFVYPPGPTEMAAVRRTAEVAIKDNSCPSCRDEPGPSSAAATRAGMTQDGRLPQPSCGLPVVQGLAAPPFFAAEWPRRLLAESAPFGMRMGGKSERESVQTLRRYQRNLSQPLRCAYATCAVVGSAGSLRGTDFGAAIDAHAAVVRVNAAPVRGHEGAVGRRTTWRVHNSEKPYFMASLGHRELQLVVCHMQWIGACQHLAFGGAFADTASLVNPRFYGELWSLLGRPAGKRSPSTGLLAIALALGVCGRVSLYGFSAPTERRGRCERHYWECPAWAEQQSYHEPKHAFHSWSSEVRLREEWRASGLVDDGPSTYGPGEAGAAAVRAADPRNGSAARRQRWVALSQGRGAQERPGSTGSRARSRRRRIVARGPPSVEAARRA